MAGAAAHSDGVCFHWFSLAFPAGSGSCLFLLEWALALHGTFALLAPSITPESEAKTGADTDLDSRVNRQFHLLPSYADKILGDKKCFCSTASIAGRWACFGFQMVPLWGYLVALHLQRSPVALRESQDHLPWSRNGSWVAAGLKVDIDTCKKLKEKGGRGNWSCRLPLPLSFSSVREKREVI